MKKLLLVILMMLTLSALAAAAVVVPQSGVVASIQNAPEDCAAMMPGQVGVDIEVEDVTSKMVNPVKMMTPYGGCDIAIAQYPQAAEYAKTVSSINETNTAEKNVNAGPPNVPVLFARAQDQQVAVKKTGCTIRT